MNAPLPPSSSADPGVQTDVSLPQPGVIKRVLSTMRLWVDSHSSLQSEADALRPQKADWLRLIPFIGIHLACLTVIWVGWSWTAVTVAIALYAVRMFAITGFYHRYLSHRSYSTSRFFQFVLACIGNSSVQRGPLWWAAHHRHHHRYSDQPEDHHSPRQRGFIWAHMGWVSSKANFRTNLKLVPDLAKFPELMFLDRFDTLIPALLGTSCFFLGYFLNIFYPELGTSGLQMLIWGFCISTVAVAHGTFCVNSLTHIIGTQPYPSKDDSRNSLLIALITFGEGWHNNHHYYQSSVRQGFHWWQIDMSFYALWLMSRVGLVWGLKPVPEKVAHPERALAAEAARAAEPEPEPVAVGGSQQP
jgi:stearoyl-CoA desaturase (delta-9 desaturase)